MKKTRKGTATPAKPQKHPGGRPSKFSDARMSKIVRAVRDAQFLATAARLAGVDVSTVHRWMQRGLETITGPDGKPIPNPDYTPEFREFRDAVRRAESRAERDAVRALKVLALGSPDAAKFYLSRRFKQWRDPATKTEISGPKGGPIAIDAVTPAKARALMAEAFGEHTTPATPSAVEAPAPTPPAPGDAR